MSALALSVTSVPSSNSKLQVAPQLIPAGLDVTVPEPAPVLETVSLNLAVGSRSKVAVTDLAEVIVTRHLFSPLTESQPDQATALVLAPGVPVSVTAVPWSKLAEQVAPQLIPAGELVTVPEPVPFLVTVSRCCSSANVAVTDFASDIVTLQVPVPEQPLPDQPLKVEPDSALALSVTSVPSSNSKLQVGAAADPGGAGCDGARARARLGDGRV